MILRRFVVFTLFLLLVVAAPVWANTAGVPDLPRVSDVVNVLKGDFESSAGVSVGEGITPDDRRIACAWTL